MKFDKETIRLKLEQWKRPIKIMLMGGIPLGILLIILKEFFHIPEAILMRYYWLIGVAVVLLAMVFNLLYHMHWSKKLIGLTKILVQEKDYQRFIEENYKLMEKTWGDFNKNLILINICAGYGEMGDYKKVKETLEKCDLKVLKGINKTIYYINLAGAHFYLRENKAARAIMDAQREDFDALADHETLGSSIALLRVLELRSLSKWAEAEASLQKAIEKYPEVTKLQDLQNYENPGGKKR